MVFFKSVENVITLGKLQCGARFARPTRTMVPITRRASSVLKVFNVRMLGFKNKIEMRKRRQNNNRPINLRQGNNILHILHVHHLTQNFISRAYTIFNNCCIAMYVS